MNLLNAFNRGDIDVVLALDLGRDLRHCRPAPRAPQKTALTASGTLTATSGLRNTQLSAKFVS